MSFLFKIIYFYKRLNFILKLIKKIIPNFMNNKIN